MTEAGRERLLGEVEELLRTMPPRATIRHDTDENLAWLGRVAAVVEAWSPARIDSFNALLEQFGSKMAIESNNAFRQMIRIIHQMRHALMLQSDRPLNTFYQKGGVFRILMAFVKRFNRPSKMCYLLTLTLMASLLKNILYILSLA